MAADTMESVFAVLEPHGVLDDRVISALRHLFDGRLISEIGGMKVHQLAAEITARRELAELPSNVRSGDVARELLRFMRDMEFAVTPAAQLPTVKVEFDKTPRDMNLTELLTLLAAEPSRYHELVPLILEQQLVRIASAKSPNWVLADGGRLNIQETLAYITHLAKRSSMGRTSVNGRRPTTLARLFGQEERPMRNPFALSRADGEVTGPFFEDYDLGNLTEEAHLAYLWARETGHRHWPQSLDLFTHIPEAFAAAPTGRWKVIIDDYRAAKKAGEPSTEGLSRYASPGSRRPFDGEERDEAWYRRQLEQWASRGINQLNKSVHRGCEIVRFIQTTNSSITLGDTVVLGHIVTTNGSIKGRAYIPRGVKVQTTNGSVKATLYELTWRDLYHKAVELKLISTK